MKFIMEINKRKTICENITLPQANQELGIFAVYV